MITEAIKEEDRLQEATTTGTAIYYHPDGFDTSQKKLMGRQAAGESFLKGYAQHTQLDRLYCYAKTKAHFEDFNRRIQTLGRLNSLKESVWVPNMDDQQLAEAGCLFIPGPGLGEFAWQRRFGDQRAYSLCGVTHTTASDRIMDSLGELCIAPTQSWDAVICTSRAVHAMVTHLLETYREYLSERFQASLPPCPVQLPIIPLGIDTQSFAPSEAVRASLRAKLQIEQTDIAVLFMGRLSFHAKAHPLPMYQALEQAARQTGQRIHLLMAGWFANEHLQNQFMEGAKRFCPSVKVFFLDGRKPEIRQNIWQAADIFTSLSDNIQETFGLTPIEAMAAGLPVVVSDWDGYRDMVRPGIDGFTIPTIMPPPGSGEVLAKRYFSGEDTYDLYIGQASQCTAVDTKACTEAFISLIENPDLRRQMGEAGRIQAQAHYDWSVVIPQYQELWQELAERRAQEGEAVPRKEGVPAHSLREDPFSLFQQYPTGHLQDTTKIQVRGNDFNKLVSLEMNRFCHQILLKPTDLQRLTALLFEKKELTVRETITCCLDMPQDRLYRTLGWLGKLSLIRFIL